MAYIVEYYEKEDGSRPAEEFILAQNAKMRAKIFTMLEFLESKGPELREPYWKTGFLSFAQNRGAISHVCCTFLLWTEKSF